MKGLKHIRWICILGVFFILGTVHALNINESSNTYDFVKENFKIPLSNTGVICWWWLNGNVNKAAITKDLEAMKSRNFHGAMIFDAGGHNQRGNKEIPKGPQVPNPRSPFWQEETNFFLGIWERIINHQRPLNTEVFTIAPEFGAWPYIWTSLEDNSPVANQWDINLYMKNLLLKKLSDEK